MDHFKKQIHSIKKILLNFFKKQCDLIKNKIGLKPINSDDPNFYYENRVVPLLKKELGFLGYEAFDPNYRMSFLYGLVIFDASSYLVINGIDIWLIRESDFESICFCLVTWMFGISGLSLIYASLSKKLLLCDLLKIIYSFGKNFDKETESEEIQKYVKHSKDCQSLCIITTILFSGGGLISLSYPIVIYFVTGEAVLPFGFFIPGVSTTSNPGYWINYFYQIIQTALTVIGVMQTTFHSLLIFVSNLFFQIDNMIIKLRKLSGAIEAKPNIAGHEEQLSSIIKLHQQFQFYLSMVDNFYNNFFSVNIACYATSTIITLYVLVNKFWFIGYYILTVFVGLIFLPCAIGTSLEFKNDELVREIYEVPWHLLTPKERKTFCTFLVGAQATEMPSCGGYLPLNFESFRLIYSKIYSFLMFLIDTHKK